MKKLQKLNAKRIEFRKMHYNDPIYRWIEEEIELKKNYRRSR